MGTTLISPKNNAIVRLQTKVQRTFKDRAVSGEILKEHDWLALKRSKEKDHTFPRSVKVSWDTDENVSLFELSTDIDFSDCVRLQTIRKELNIQNLFVNTTYYWRVNGCKPYSFTTEDVAPRWIFAEGLSNVRDIGNWVTSSGARTKQGLLFRGTEMDYHHDITPAGRWTMAEELHIKTDLDLRGESIGSPMGDKMDFLQILAGPYAYFLKDKEICKQLFDVFADESRYPIYLHCWGGADRTGTIFFILNAMLGVAYEDLVLDFELTTLSIWGERSRNSELFIGFMNALNQYGDENTSVNQKVVNFLLECGVTIAQMDKIKSILLEEKTSCEGDRER